MLITDRRLAGGAGALVDAVAEAVEGGVTAVQLREKDLPPEELLPLAQQLRTVTRNRAAFIVNSSLQVALASVADGVHLTENAAMVERPERPLLIGRSVHSREAAQEACAACSDYLVAGPIFKTASHPNATPAGLELIESIAGDAAVPVLAVGGITDRRVGDVVRAGASGVAVISSILSSNSPGRAAQLLKQALLEEWADVEVGL
jgi:thiamine-phosphate pyrophosphorylase